MGKEKRADRAKGGSGGNKLAQRQREIAASLERLGNKIARLHDRQKRLRRHGRDRKRENLAFARDLRKLQRKTNGLLDQLSELKADGRRMEQRMAANLLSAGEVSASLASYDNRLAITDQRLEKMQSSGQELERLGQQMRGRADALERHIRVMQQELHSYAQAASAGLTLPVESERAQEAEAPEVVNGSANGDGSRSPCGNGEGSNVLAFRKAEQEAAGIDDRLLEELDKRISGLERLAGGLDERIQGFDLAMHDMEDSQRQLRGEQESIRQWLEQQGEDLFAGQDALRAEAAGLDASLQELKQARDADQEILTRLDQGSAAWAERIGRLEQQQVTADARAEGLAGQVDGLESTAQALSSDAEQRREESHSLQGRAADLDRGLERVREAGSVVLDRLGSLDAADGRLAEGHRELTERTGALSTEFAAMASRQGRLGFGLGLLGLLLLALAIAGYWLVDSRIEGQARIFAQDLTELQQGLQAGEDRLDAQVAELSRVSQASQESAAGVSQIENMVNLVQSQDQLLIAQRQDLGQVQGALEALRAEQERLLARTESLEQALQAFESRQRALRSGVTASEPEPAPADATAAPALGEVLGPDWIAAQNPAHYTIQIVAAHDPRVIARTARAHPYSADLAQYPRLRNERDWHALLHGSYPNLKAAMAALDRLPAEIKVFGPWVRSFGTVQRQLSRP